MGLFLQQLANGLVIGSTYAVVALGFSLTFTIMRVINFAYPDIFMVGMFAGLVAAAELPIGFAGALVAGALGAGAIGYLLERTVVAPLRGRDVLISLIATLGARLCWKTRCRSSRAPILSPIQACCLAAPSRLAPCCSLSGRSRT